MLCVRQIRDPRPGSVRIHTAAGPLSLDWEQAVRDRLDSISTSALRPAHTRVTSSAEAVLFADTAELLACLASDLCAGYAHERWWWRSLYGERDLKHVLLGALLEPPNSVPSVLEHLARQAQTIAFVQRLTEREVDVLITGMLTAFGLVELQAAFTSPVVPGPDRPKRPRADATQSTSVPRHATRGDARRRPTPSASPPADSDRPPLPPWAGLVPESADPGLSPRQQLLLGVALLLGRSPRSVRSADFVRATRTWWAEITRPSLSPADVSPVSERQLGGQLARPTRRRSATTPASGVSRNATRPSLTPGIVRHHPPERSRPATLPTVESPPNTEPASDSEPDCSHEPPPPGPRAADPVPDAVVIHTQLGGIFYLLNVGIALDLYGDFTQPLRPGIDLSIWDFLTLVARRLLRRHYPADPIWNLLRELAGRGPRQAPGADFSPPAE